MKRSEPLWKRKAAREHCKRQRDLIWDKLSTYNKPVKLTDWTFSTIFVDTMVDPVVEDAF